MEPTKINSKAIDTIAEKIKKGDEDAIGSYLFKGLRIQISNYQASGSERFARLYKKRRSLGLCVICSKKVTEKNLRTKKLYRLCDEHRLKTDKKKQ